MATSQVMNIKAKNVACLKTLLSIAQTDGNYLGDAWYEVCLSTVSRDLSNTIVYFFNRDSEMY
jgi:hypothetical protein